MLSDAICLRCKKQILIPQPTKHCQKCYRQGVKQSAEYDRLTEKEFEMVEDVEIQSGSEFIKRNDNGTYVFNWFAEKSERQQYCHYVLGTCVICEKDHFRRKRKRVEQAHRECFLIMRRGARL
jgi:hypothetical protein